MAEESKVEQAPSTDLPQQVGMGEELGTLRQTLSEKENRLKQLETEIETVTVNANAKLKTQAEEIAGLKGTLGGVAIKYRQILLSGSPEVPEELVKGETVEEIESSFAQARQVVEKVRRGLESKQQRERVSPGAPPRSPLDISAMSPQEKIAYALRKGG